MSELPLIVGPLLGLFAGLGLAASAGLHTSTAFLVLGVAAAMGAAELPAVAAPLATGPGLCLAAVVSLLPSALLVHHGFGIRPGPGPVWSAVSGAGVAYLWLVATVEGAWLYGGVAAAMPVAAIVRLTATRARAAQGLRPAGRRSVGPAFGEYVAGCLVASVAIYSSVTVPMVVAALLAGAIRMGRTPSRVVVPEAAR